MMSPVYTVLWPVVGGLFLLSAIVCLARKRWGFGIGLLIPGVLLLGGWLYDRTHEEVSQLQVMLLDNKLVRENREHPERSVFYVRVTALEMGNYQGNLRAADIRLTSPGPKPGAIVAVQIGKHPLTGSYLKSMASLDYGKPPPKYTYVPPAKGGEFQHVFRQPVPASATLEQVLSEHDHQMAKVGLAFRTDRATFERIRPANFEPIPFESFSAQISAKHETVWWRSATRSTEIWGRNARDGKSYQRSPEDHFDTERAMMTWDADGLVQYFWYGGGLRTDR